MKKNKTINSKIISEDNTKKEKMLIITLPHFQEGDMKKFYWENNQI